MHEIMRMLFTDNFGENFGVGYLSSVLKKEGHKTDLFYDPSLSGSNSAM